MLSNIPGAFFPRGLVLGFLGIKFHFPDLNPFHWIRDWLKDLYNSVGKIFDALILHPPRIPPGAWQHVLVGESMGLANSLWNTGLVIMLVVVMFWQPAIGKLPRYLAYAFTSILIGPYILAIVNWLYSVGDALVKALVYNPTGPGSNLILLPHINNILGLIFMIIVLLALGFPLALLLASYVLFVLAFEAAFLPVLWLAALVNRVQRWLEWLVQMLLVATIFGRAAAVGWISLAKLAVDKVPWIDQNGFSGFVLAGALVLATASNVALLVAAHYGYSQVTGKVKAYVSGTVTALERKRQELLVRDPNRAFESAMQPVPVEAGSSRNAGAADSQAYSRAMSDSAAAIHNDLGGDEPPKPSIVLPPGVRSVPQTG